MTIHLCQCDCFTKPNERCASQMTQEDLLCDPCREFKSGRSGLHFARSDAEHGHMTSAKFSFVQMK